MKYTRKKLIEICEKAIVPYEKWGDRDTPEAQAQIGTILVYLKAGCKFKIKNEPKGIQCVTNEDTIWLEIIHYQFEDSTDYHTYYMPTINRIKNADGGNWYCVD